ncbi:MAG: MerR family transcriptional regulator [Candidatus Caldatribacteriaceae bacterium]
MVLAKCKRCGKIFNKVLEKDVCPECLDKEEEEFQKVRNFFREHPRAKLEEASQGTGVDKKIILQFLKEGRLQLSLSEEEFLKEGLFCERCGKPILQGKLCVECRQKLGLIVSHSEKEEKKEKKARPRFYFKEMIEKRFDKP